MNRENFVLIINTIAMAILSLVLVLSYDFVSNKEVGSEYDSLFGVKTELSDKVSITDDHVVAKTEILSNDKVVGFIYEIEGTYEYDVSNGNGNMSEGDFNLELVIDTAYIIKAYNFNKYGHTENSSFQTKAYEFFDSVVADKVSLHDLANLSASSSAGATWTGAAIIDMLTNLYNYLEDVGTSNTVLNVEKIFDGNNDLVETVYTVTTEKIDYFNGNEGVVVLKLTVNLDDVITSYTVDKYEHTPGDREDKALKLIQDLIDEEVDLKDIGEIVTGGVGVTNTKNALKEMILSLSQYIKDGGQ